MHVCIFIFCRTESYKVASTLFLLISALRAYFLKSNKAMQFNCEIIIEIKNRAGYEFCGMFQTALVLSFVTCIIREYQLLSMSFC